MRKGFFLNKIRELKVKIELQKVVGMGYYLCQFLKFEKIIFQVDWWINTFQIQGKVWLKL